LQLDQLERLTGSVEFALVQKDVLFGLRQGTLVLRAIQREMGGLVGVEKLMEETEEARAYQEVCRGFPSPTQPLIVG
jgi:charged multivesicular body protein 6